MFDFSKRTDTKSYLDSIIKELKGVKIKSVFTLSSPSWNDHRGFRTYDSDTELFIMFENGMCLVIDYRFIDSLEVEYRKLTDEELEQYTNTLVKDYFNGSQDIYSLKLDAIERTESIILNYSDVVNVVIRPVTEEYEKWLDNDTIDFVSPNEETFDEITFIMSNDKTITICADCASSDGYVMFWSKEADCKIQKHSQATN